MMQPSDKEYLVPKKATFLRRLVQGVIVLFIVTGLLYFWSWKKAEDITFHSQSPSQQAQIFDAENPEKFIKHIRIAGIDLYVPVVYFSSSLSSQTDYTDIFFQAYYPSFEWVISIPYEQKPYNSDVIVVGISDPESKTDLTELANRNINSTIKPYKKNENQKYQLDIWESAQSTDQNDYLISWKNSIAEVFFRCTNDQNSYSVNHQCRMLFKDGAFVYNVRFDKKHLPKWQNVKSKSIAFINQFKAKPTDYQNP